MSDTSGSGFVFDALEGLYVRAGERGEAACVVIVLAPAGGAAGKAAWCSATFDRADLRLGAKDFTARYTLPATTAALQRIGPDAES